MTKFGSPIICSLGKLPDCNPGSCLVDSYVSLGNILKEAKKRALYLMKNPPKLGTCEFGARMFLDCYPRRGGNIRYFYPGIPLIVDIETGYVVPFNDEDLNSHLY